MGLKVKYKFGAWQILQKTFDLKIFLSYILNIGGK